MKLRCPCCNNKVEIRIEMKAVDKQEKKGIPVPPSGQPMNTESHTYNGPFDDVDGT